MEYPWTIREYSLTHYPFPEWVKLAIGEDDLTALRLDGPRWTERQDQQSPWHRAFYDSFGKWRAVYREFVEQVVAPWIGRPFYFQATPTFRVHLPGNVAVGTFHTDATYHHPEDEVTFWVPCTPTSSTSVVWIADDSDYLHAPDVQPGQLVEFSAATRRHGNFVNVTGASRVSFDFRCLSTDLLPNVEGPPSENTKLRFVPGGYYDAKMIDVW